MAEIFKMPYTREAMTMAVYRVGRTLVFDRADFRPGQEPPPDHHRNMPVSAAASARPSARRADPIGASMASSGPDLNSLRFGHARRQGSSCGGVSRVADPIVESTTDTEVGAELTYHGMGPPPPSVGSTSSKRTPIKQYGVKQ